MVGLGTDGYSIDILLSQVYLISELSNVPMLVGLLLFVRCYAFSVWDLSRLGYKDTRILEK
jgi:hypothetical protein